MSEGPDTLNAAADHYTVTVGDDEFYVVGDIEPADRSVGIMSATFVPAWLFDMDGNRRRDVEKSLDHNDWDHIAEQVEAVVDEGYDEDYDRREED